MCGIAGFVSRRPHGVQERLMQMSQALKHRGPDESGTRTVKRAGLTMRRLAITGVDNGWQPIANEDGRLLIVGNGEIYNAPELRAELEDRGHDLRTDSDIEVALHAFEDDGVAAFDRLNGMFALAILDRDQECMTVVRDRLGIKPLYYADTSAGLSFASELSAIRQALLPEESAALSIDEAALWDYLALGYVPSPRSIFSGIRRLPPGHVLEASPTGHRVREWWRLPDYEADSTRTIEDFSDEIIAILEDSVRLRTMGDVEAGALLSGGLDSSTLVGLLSRYVQTPIKTFTLGVGPVGGDDDEIDDAAMTANHFGCEHFTERLGGVDATDLDELFSRHGEPFADVSLLPTARVAKLASRHVKFVISGDGGDELFAGYSWLKHEAKLRALPAPIRGAARWLRPLLRYGQDSVRRDLLGKALRVVGDLSSSPATSFLRRRALTTSPLRHGLLSERFAAGHPATHSLEEFASSWTGDPFDLLLDLDRRYYLPGDILEKVDRASMRFSLEARVPFLDHRLVELASRIPFDLQIGPRLEGKCVLRRAIAKMLPAPLLGRRKRGFGLPVDDWFERDLGNAVRERLTERAFRELDVLDTDVLGRIVDDHQAGRARHGHLLWALWSLATTLTANHDVPIAPLTV